MNFENDELYDTGDWIDDEALISQLTFPFSKHEPSLDDVELQRLDALAYSLEIQRLTKMGHQSPSSFLRGLLGLGVKS